MATTESGPSQEVMAEKAIGGSLKTPITAPLASVTLPQNPALTADQEKKFEDLLGRAKAWEQVPSTQGKEGPLTDAEKQWLTRECLLRYLRAVKWNVLEAEKRLLGTMTWRREYGVDELTPDFISPENETGKQIQIGYDKQGRPCHYLNPGRQNTDVSPRQVQHLVYMVERVIDIMPAQQEKLCLLINFKASKNRTNTAPGIGQGREVLNILQTHYPERLGRALIINVPWVVWGFFKLITPFIDPLTREKLKFNEDMSQYVPKEHLWAEYPNGGLDFEYDHSVYWPALNKLAAERRALRKQLWESGGRHIGELEDYLNGHAAKGIAPPAPVPTEAKVASGAALENGEAKDGVKHVTEGVAKVAIETEPKEDAAPAVPAAPVAADAEVPKKEEA